MSKWNKSTLADVPNFCYRYHWFLMTSETPHADMFDGDITLCFIRNVKITAGNATVRNSEKHSRLVLIFPHEGRLWNFGGTHKISKKPLLCAHLGRLPCRY